MPPEIGPVGRPPSSTPHAIACMEVWGGSQAFDQSVTVPGNDVQISCTPFAGEAAGGDIYYVSNCAAGIITRFVLADVSGHGTKVAHIAAELRKLMRRHINTANQSHFAVELNKAFAGLDLNGNFATAILATYFAPTSHFIICNAGHPRPLLFRAATGKWELLDRQASGVLATEDSNNDIGIANLPLGIVDPTHYEQVALHVDVDDLIVIYSDAMIEAASPAGRELSEAGLLAMAQTLSKDERKDVARSIRHKLSEFVGGIPLNDDATFIVLHHNAQAPPRTSWRGQAARIGRMLGLGSIDSGPASNQ